MAQYNFTPLSYHVCTDDNLLEIHANKFYNKFLSTRVSNLKIYDLDMEQHNISVANTIHLLIKENKSLLEDMINGKKNLSDLPKNLEKLSLIIYEMKQNKIMIINQTLKDKQIFIINNKDQKAEFVINSEQLQILDLDEGDIFVYGGDIEKIQHFYLSQKKYNLQDYKKISGDFCYQFVDNQTSIFNNAELSNNSNLQQCLAYLCTSNTSLLFIKSYSNNKKGNMIFKKFEQINNLSGQQLQESQLKLIEQRTCKIPFLQEKTKIQVKINDNIVIIVQNTGDLNYLMDGFIQKQLICILKDTGIIKTIQNYMKDGTDENKKKINNQLFEIDVKFFGYVIQELKKEQLITKWNFPDLMKNMKKVFNYPNLQLLMQLNSQNNPNFYHNFLLNCSNQKENANLIKLLQEKNYSDLQDQLMKFVDNKNLEIQLIKFNAINDLFKNNNEQIKIGLEVNFVKDRRKLIIESNNFLNLVFEKQDNEEQYGKNILKISNDAEILKYISDVKIKMKDEYSKIQIDKVSDDMNISIMKYILSVSDICPSKLNKYLTYIFMAIVISGVAYYFFG